MIRSRSPISQSELCILDENSEEVHNMHSHDGLLDENAEEVHNLHNNLKSPDGLLDENSEEVHNLQSPDEKNVSPWWELVHNLQSPDEKQGGGESIGATIRIGQEIRCLPYAGL